MFGIPKIDFAFISMTGTLFYFLQFEAPSVWWRSSSDASSTLVYPRLPYGSWILAHDAPGTSSKPVQLWYSNGVTLDAGRAVVVEDAPADVPPFTWEGSFSRGLYPITPSPEIVLMRRESTVVSRDNKQTDAASTAFVSHYLQRGPTDPRYPYKTELQRRSTFYARKKRLVAIIDPSTTDHGRRTTKLVTFEYK